MRASRPFDWRHTPGLGAFTTVILVFLYLPLVILVVYAFNANQLVTVWSGFSLRWFGEVAANEDIRRAAFNSIIIAIAATIASTVIATAGAIALERGDLKGGRGLVTSLIALPLIVPEIIVAIMSCARKISRFSPAFPAASRWRQQASFRSTPRTICRPSSTRRACWLGRAGEAAAVETR